MLADSLHRGSGGRTSRGNSSSGGGGGAGFAGSVDFGKVALIALGATAAVGSAALLYKAFSRVSNEGEQVVVKKPTPLATGGEKAQPVATVQIDDDDAFSPHSCEVNKAAMEKAEAEQMARYESAPVVWDKSQRHNHPVGGEAARQERIKAALALRAKRLATGDPMWIDFYDDGADDDNGWHEDGWGPDYEEEDEEWHDDYHRYLMGMDEEEEEDEGHWHDEEGHDLLDDDEWVDDEAANVNDLLGITERKKKKKAKKKKNGDDTSSVDTSDIEVTDRQIYEVAKIRWAQLPDEMEEAQAKKNKYLAKGKKVPKSLEETIKDIEEEIEYTEGYLKRNREQYGVTLTGTAKGGNQQGHHQNFGLGGPAANDAGPQRGYGSGYHHNGAPIGAARFVDPDADEMEEAEMDNWGFDDDEDEDEEEDGEWGYDADGKKLEGVTGAGGWGRGPTSQQTKSKQAKKMAKSNKKPASKFKTTGHNVPSHQDRVDKQFAEMWSQGIEGGIPDGSEGRSNKKKMMPTASTTGTAEEVAEKERWARYHQATVGDEEGDCWDQANVHFDDESEDEQLKRDIEEVNNMSEEQKEILAKIFLDAYAHQSAGDPTTEEQLEEARRKLGVDALDPNAPISRGGKARKTAELEDKVGDIIEEHEKALLEKKKTRVGEKSEQAAAAAAALSNQEAAEGSDEEWEDATTSDEDEEEDVGPDPSIYVPPSSRFKKNSKIGAMLDL